MVHVVLACFCQCFIALIALLLDLFSNFVRLFSSEYRALSIISPDCSYGLCLSIYDLDTLRSRREEQCFKLFNVIPVNHKLSHLLPPKNVNHYNLRRNRKYDLPSVRAKRFQRSFIPAMCRLTNNTV